MNQDEPKTAAFPPPRFWVILGLTAFFLVIVFESLGFPENTQAFIWMAMVVVLCLATMVDRFWYISAFSLASLFSLVLVGWESDHLIDIRGGRRGIEINPGQIRFASAGENSGLLKEHLGPSKPEWIHANIRHMLFRDWRDGNERFHTRSIIFREYLPDVLERLPHREARVQVLECSTDSTNLAKLHQDMLLVALKELGYPPGYDAQTWWDKHKALFVSASTPQAATFLVAGWVKRMEKELLSEKTPLLSQHVWHASRAHSIDESLVEGVRNNPPVLPVTKVAWWTKR